MKFDSEAEMLDALVPWLEERGWEVYKEVECPGGYTDIVAKKQGYLWGIEGKLSCSEAVVHQAERSLQTYHINSIAIPRRPNSIYDFYLKEKGIGCLLIEKYERYEGPEDFYVISSDERADHTVTDTRIVITGIPEMNEDPKKLDRIMLHESMKTQRAGTTGEKRVTKYKVTVLHVQEYIQKNGPSSMETLLENVEMHWMEHRCKYNLKSMLTDWEEHKFKRVWDDDKLEHVFHNKKDV